jgi:hypothetical protein
MPPPPPVGFEPTIPKIERPQTQVVDLLGFKNSLSTFSLSSNDGKCGVVSAHAEGEQGAVHIQNPVHFCVAVGPTCMYRHTISSTCTYRAHQLMCQRPLDIKLVLQMMPRANSYFGRHERLLPCTVAFKSHGPDTKLLAHVWIPRS